MKTLLIAAALLALTAVPVEAGKIKRNCLWNGGNFFKARLVCSDGNTQSRPAPNRTARPEPEKPECKEHKGKNKERD